MAEGKALGKEDLFVNGVFDDAKRGATELLAVIKETQVTIKGSIAAQKEFVSTFKAKSYDDVKQLNQAMAETNQLIKQQETLTKAEIQVQQQSEKLNQEKLKTQREEIKNQQLIEKQNKATEKSLKDLNGEYKEGVQRLSAIKKELKELSFSGKDNTKTFKALQKEFTELDKKVRKAEEGVGEFQRNVGNYKSAFEALPAPMRDAAEGAKNLGSQLLNLAKNPLILVVTLLTAAIYGLYKAFASSDSGAVEIATRMEQVSAILDVIRTRAIILVGAFKDLFSGNFSAASDKFSQAVAGTSEQLEIATQAARDYTEALDALEDSQNNYISNAAEAANKIAKLEFTAADRTKSNAVRRAALKEAIRISEDEAKQQGKFAQQKLDIELNYLAKKNGVDAKQIMAFIKMSDAEQANASASMKNLRNNYEDKFKELENYYKDVIDADTKFFQENKKNNAKLSGFDAEIQKEKAEEAAKEAERKKQELEANMSLEAQIRAMEIAIIADETLRKKAQIEEQFRLDQIRITQQKGDAKLKAEALIALEKKLQQDLAQVDIDAKKSAEERQAEADKKDEDRAAKRAEKKKKEFDALWKKAGEDAKNELELEKKKNQEIMKEADKVAGYLQRALERRNKEKNDLLEQETEANKKAIEAQERLAERGLENTLAFEKEKAAKLELEKRRQQEKEIRQQKIFAFYQLFSSYAKTDPNTALQKAIVDTALAEVISGAFIDGTENVARDLQGNKVHNGQDGYVVAVDGNERIFNPSQNAKIGNISNEDAAQILHDYQKGVLFNYGNIEQPKGVLINQNIELRETNNLLKQLLSVTNNKPVHQTNIDNLGNIVHAEIRNGIAKVTTHRRRI
jgi:DNA repair exonuclease SbcCD ATPase subunit